MDDEEEEAASDDEEADDGVVVAAEWWCAVLASSWCGCWVAVMAVVSIRQSMAWWRICAGGRWKHDDPYCTLDGVVEEW